MTDTLPLYATRFRMPIGDPDRPFHGVTAQTDDWHVEAPRGQGHGDYFPGSPMARSGQFHHLGEDWNWGVGRDDVGAPVHAVSHGTVIYVGAPWETEARSGQMVILRHTLPPGSDDGQGGRFVYSLYGHVTASEGLAVGQTVALGDVIGVIADLDPNSFSPHLHFEMRWKDAAGIPDVITPDYVLPGGTIGTGYFQAPGTGNAAEIANAMGWFAPSEFIEARLADGDRDDFASGPGTSGRIVIGEIGEDQIWGVLDERPEGQFDTDWFAVDLQAGVTYAFAVRGADTADQTQGNPTLANPSLRIRDPEGNQITWDGRPWATGQQTADDGAGGRDVRVTFTAPEDGTYHLVVFSSTQETGSYRLSGVETTAPPAAIPAQPGLKGPGDGSVFVTGTGANAPTLGTFVALRADGSLVAWGNEGSSLVPPGLIEGIADRDQNVFLSTDQIIAVDGNGAVSRLGDFSGKLVSDELVTFASVADRLGEGVVSVSSTVNAHAALTRDGAVVTWGSVFLGGDSSAVADRLSEGVEHIYANGFAFAALKSDGSVVPWGSFPSGGGLPEPVPGVVTATAADLAGGVVSIHTTQGAFAALKSDGSVVAWGDGPDGDITAVAEELQGGVVSIASNIGAFAALKADGSVVTWGWDAAGSYDTTGAFRPQYDPGGALAARLSADVVSIHASESAFAALKSDGSVLVWGARGGNASAVADQLQGGVTQIFSTLGAFAALKEDGSVVTWGDDPAGDSSGVADRLASGVERIYSTAYAFAALKSDGSVVTWGEYPLSDFFGDLVAPPAGLDGGVRTIYTTRETFAALKEDGTVLTWGTGILGGDSSAVAELLAEGVIGLASPFGPPALTGLGADAPVLPNRPPVADLVGVVTSEVGEEATLDIAARFSDPDGDALAFSFDGLPAGITAQGGQLTGTVTAAPGAYVVTVTADDGRGGSVTDSFTWQIRAPEPEAPPYRPTGYDLEYLAKMVAYGRDPSDIPEGYVALAPFEGQLGFFAVPLVSATGEPILAIRGTASALDAVTNTNFRGIGYDQVEEIWPQLSAWLAANPGTHITGHSLGGAQTQLVAAWATEAGIPLGQVATFNAPGINASQTARFDAGLALGVTHHIASGDVVSKAGERFLPGDVLFYNMDTLDLPTIPGPLSLLVPYQQIPNAHTGHWAQVFMHSQTNPDGSGKFTQYLLPSNYRFASQTLTSEDLSSPGFSFLYSGDTLDQEYMAFLLSLSRLGLPHVSAGLATRGTAEVLRKGVGLGVLGTVELLELGQAAIQAITGALDTMADWTLDTLRTVGRWTADTWRGLSDWRAETWAAVSDWTSTQWDGLTGWTSAQWGMAQDFTDPVWADMRAWGADVWTASANWGVETYTNIARFGAAVGTGTGEAVRNVREAIGDGASAVGEFFKGSTTLWGLLSRGEAEETPILMTGEGALVQVGTTPGSGFLIGAPGSVAEMVGGGNVVFGTPETLDGGRLIGVGSADRIIYADMTVGAGAMQLALGSAVVAIDSTGDGVADSTLRLEGDYDLEAFRLLPHADGMALFYGDPPAEEVATVTVSLTGRDGAPLAGADLELHRPGGSGLMGRSDGDGHVSFDVMRGVEGSLQADLDAGGARVTTGAALEALRLAVGLPPSWGPAQPLDFIAADVNGDGQVTTADALQLLRSAVGLPADAAPRWIFLDSAADLSHVGRTDTRVETGLRLDPVTADTGDLALTAILTGDLRAHT